MAFSKGDLRRNAFMLNGSFAHKGYDWWWHHFTAVNAKTGEKKSFFIEFFTCNPALGGNEVVYGQLPENQAKGKRPSYVMVKAGTWGEDKAQLHRFFPWNEVKLHKAAPYSIEADDCFASDFELRGSVSVTAEEAAEHPEMMSDAGAMSWNLQINKQIAYNVGYGADRRFRDLKAFEMYWHAEGIKTAYSGEVVYNGELYLVSPTKSYGYADKNWGRNFTSPWVWISSNCMKSKLTGKKLKNSALEIGGGNPKLYCLPLGRKLLGGLYHEGHEYEFNFSKFWTLSRTKFNYRETEDEIQWYVRQETLKYVMVTRVRCKKAEMLLVNYESPDGKKRHNRLWNGGTGTGNVKIYRKHCGNLIMIDDIAMKHVGCEYGQY